MEKAMATHSSISVWKIPWMEEPGSLQSMGSRRVRHDWANSLLLFTFMHWRRKWQPTPVFLPGESQGRGSLVGCRLWGRTKSDNDCSDLAAAAAAAAVPFSLQFPPCTGQRGGYSMTIMMISKWIMQVFQKLHLCMFLKYGAPREPQTCPPGLFSTATIPSLPRHVWTIQPGSQHHPETDYKISSALASFTLRLAYIHFPSRKWFLLP